MISRDRTSMCLVAAATLALAACGRSEQAHEAPPNAPSVEANTPAVPDASRPVSSGNEVAADVAASAALRASFDPARDPAADLETAKVEAARGNRRIILDVGGEWCERCQLLDDLVDGDSTLRSLRDAGFVWVKVNVSEENHNAAFLAGYPPVERHPHLLVLDADGALLRSQPVEALEEGDSFSVERVAAFLEDWTAAAPPEAAPAPAADAGADAT